MDWNSLVNQSTLCAALLLLALILLAGAIASCEQRRRSGQSPEGRKRERETDGYNAQMW